MPVWLSRTESPAVIRADREGGELHGFTLKSDTKDPTPGTGELKPQTKRVQQLGGEEHMREPWVNCCTASQVEDWPGISTIVHNRIILSRYY